MPATSIEWASHTESFLYGCSRLGPDCGNCQALRRAQRISKTAKSSHIFSKLIEEKKPGVLDWTGELNFIPAQIAPMLRWRKPRRVFLNPMSDVFHTHSPIEAQLATVALAAALPQHTWMVLTKRPLRALLFLDQLAQMHVTKRNAIMLQAMLRLGLTGFAKKTFSKEWPLPNLWMGTRVSSQTDARRLEPLALLPVGVRWVSCELIGPLKLPDDCADWVVIDGETGRRSRPMFHNWARSIIKQCKKSDVPVFFRQWGNWRRCGAREALLAEREKQYLFVAENGLVLRRDQLADPNIYIPLGTDSEFVKHRSAKAGANQGAVIDGRRHVAYP